MKKENYFKNNIKRDNQELSEFAKRLKILRKKSNKSQEYISKYLGLGNCT